MLKRIGPAVLGASNQPFQAAYDEQSVPGLSSGCGFVDSVIAGRGDGAIGAPSSFKRFTKDSI